MTTFDDLVMKREQAGQRYRRAAAELRAALVELAALDATLANGNVNAGHPHVQPGFHDMPDSLPLPLVHPVYSPRSGPHWRDEIATKRDEHLREFERSS